jgi:hypothetical protein
MMYDEAVLLTFWRDFLIEQSAHFKRSIIQQTGSPYISDEVKAAFLLVEEELAKDKIEKAVEAFIHDTSWPPRWPPLKPRECLHLGFRVHVSLLMIAEIVRGTPAGLLFKKDWGRDLATFRSGVRWFFLHFWKMGGKPYLAAMADDFIEKRRGQIVDGLPDHRE